MQPERINKKNISELLSKKVTNKVEIRYLGLISTQFSFFCIRYILNFYRREEHLSAMLCVLAYFYVLNVVIQAISNLCNHLFHLSIICSPDVLEKQLPCFNKSKVLFCWKIEDGKLLETKNTINPIEDQLNYFDHFFFHI